MARRTSIKGKGTDIFFEDEAQPRKQKKSSKKTVKLTVYVPPEIDERLDNEWLDRRRTDKNAQKSIIVTEALERLFEQLDGKTVER